MKRFIKTYVAVIFIFTISATAQDKFECRKITSDSDRHGFPCWSPDGESICYQITNRSDSLGKNGLWIISKDGTGAKQIFKGIAEHPKWSPDGKFIVFDADTGNSIKLISTESGIAKYLLPDSILIGKGGLPCWSPDGSQIAFVERTGPSLCVYNVNTRNIKCIYSKDGMVPLPGCFTPDGENVLVALMNKQTRKSTILKININTKSADQINVNNENFYRYLAVSPDGSLMIFAAIKDKYLGFYITLAEGGKSLPLTVSQNAHNEGPVWSSDGNSIVFASNRAGSGIWVMDLDIEPLKKELEELNK